MSSATTPRRALWRVTLVLGVAGVVLASCGTPSVPAPRVSGTPALSISVPLSNVGCTLNDVCVAIGTSSASVGPTVVAEFSTPSGRWLKLALPSTAPPLITSVACSGTQCLLAGSVSGRDLLWRFYAVTHSAVVINPPPGGDGISALTCNGLNCALIDSSASVASPRFSYSADGGATWSSPLPVTWATGDALTSLACGAVFDCAVSAVSATGQLQLFTTNDDGATWTRHSTPSSWTALSSLSCEGSDCVALAAVGSTSVLVRSSTFTAHWTNVALDEHANALACVTFTTCVVVGENAKTAPWLATVQDKVLTSDALRYVPTPLLGVACGSKVCAAIGVTTLLSLRTASKTTS